MPSHDAGQGPRHLTDGTPHVLGSEIPAAPAPPGTGTAPGWYSGRRHPRRCGEMSEAKASPARAPPRHGRLRRPEPHPQPRPVSAPFLCRSRAQLIPTTVEVRRLVPHRQNYVGGYVFTQRLSGQPGSGAPGSQSRAPREPLQSRLAGEVRGSSFFGEHTQGYRWENASPRMVPGIRRRGMR